MWHHHNRFSFFLNCINLTASRSKKATSFKWPSFDYLRVTCVCVCVCVMKKINSEFFVFSRCFFLLLIDWLTTYRSTLIYSKSSPALPAIIITKFCADHFHSFIIIIVIELINNLCSHIQHTHQKPILSIENQSIVSLLLLFYRKRNCDWMIHWII